MESTDERNKLQVTDLSNLCSAVFNASSVITLISQSYATDPSCPSPEGKGLVGSVRSVVNAARNFVLTDVDSVVLNDAQQAVDKALQSFKASLSAVQALQSIAGQESKLDQLSSVLNPIEFKDTIKRHSAKFFQGSREWLFTEIFTWLADTNSKKKVSCDIY